MITRDEWAMIRNLIVQISSVVMAGSSEKSGNDNGDFFENIASLIPGHPTFEERPTAHPYGIASMAPDGTVQVTARQGESPENRIVIAHRDKNRPKLNAAGEVMMYDGFGNQIWMQDGKIVVKLDDKLELGAGATKEAARKGDEIELTITPANITTMALSNGGGPVAAANSVTIKGTITQGSSKVTITD